MDFGALRQETLPTALAAAGEGSSAPLCAHAGTKTVLVLSGALRALERAFHDVVFRRGATLGRQAVLSIAAPGSLSPVVGDGLPSGR